MLLVFGGLSVAIWSEVVASFREGLEQQRVASKNPPTDYLPATAVVASVHDVRLDYGTYEYICEYYYMVDSIKYWDQTPCCGLSEGGNFSIMYNLNKPERDYIVPRMCWEQGGEVNILTALWISVTAVFCSAIALAALMSLICGLWEKL